ncbi:MAG: hypothetical protein IJG34_06450 [Synergistaceae bacterium]|nr:hypothetical protein [Synergistaceae bacterium]MBQ3449516.1 hypothetical protein [Synergistaceae bacterium]MBR0070548.1 hypothetical protein [Synergistaceae bacterium]
MKIKFNMDFHGEYIRNLEDLRNNFSVEDILEAYDNGLLVKWLDARYYTDELKQVKAIEAKNVRGVLEELIRIFCPETEQEEIDENLSLYDYLEERRKYREYVNANGLDELAALRKERDTQRQDENEKLKAELETLKKENENLKHEAERQKKSSSTSRSSSSSLIEAKIPAGRSGTWVCINTMTRYIIKDIGNCGKRVLVSSIPNTDVCNIEEAVSKKRIFNSLFVYVKGGYLHSDLYFYYEEV